MSCEIDLNTLGTTSNKSLAHENLLGGFQADRSVSYPSTYIPTSPCLTAFALALAEFFNGIAEPILVKEKILAVSCSSM